MNFHNTWDQCNARFWYSFFLTPFIKYIAIIKNFLDYVRNFIESAYELINEDTYFDNFLICILNLKKTTIFPIFQREKNNKKESIFLHRWWYIYKTTIVIDTFLQSNGFKWKAIYTNTTRTNIPMHRNVSNTM